MLSSPTIELPHELRADAGFVQLGVLGGDALACDPSDRFAHLAGETEPTRAAHFAMHGRLDPGGLGGGVSHESIVSRAPMPAARHTISRRP
jgi:hypothetical protein